MSATGSLTERENDSNVIDINWQLYRPFGVEGQPKKVTVKVSDFGYSEDGGTFPIKDLLKKDGYRWQQPTKSWAKIFSDEGFEIDVVTRELWFRKAEYVALKIYNDSEQLMNSYTVNQGRINTKVTASYELRQKALKRSAEINGGRLGSSEQQPNDHDYDPELDYQVVDADDGYDHDQGP